MKASKFIIKLVLLSVIVSIIVSCKSESENDIEEPIYESIAKIDGPYVFYSDKGFRVVNVNQYGQIEDRNVEYIDSLLVIVPGQEPNQFYVKMNQNIQTPSANYQDVDKIFAVSDIEGNYYSFVNLLIGNNITDQNLNWTFGDGHLVLNGDFLDRGYYVTQVLWLIYKLEQEAQEAGGAVHFILGNHEIMNLEGNFKYVRNKYIKLASELGIDHVDFYNDENVIGRWMRSKNIVEKVDNIIFVHAGISNMLLNEQQSLIELNSIARDYYGYDLENNNSTIQNLIFSSFGPLWYRGLVKPSSNYEKASANEVNSFLDYYSAEKIVIGHCIVNDISTDYDGKVVRIDLEHPDSGNSNLESKALLIENGTLYAVNDKAERIKIK